MELESRGDIDAPERAIGLLPADWVNYSLTDVGRLMDEGQGAYADEFEDSWGDHTGPGSEFSSTRWPSLPRRAASRGEHVLVLQGRFDFDAVRDELSDSGMEEGELPRLRALGRRRVVTRPPRSR